MDRIPNMAHFARLSYRLAAGATQPPMTRLDLDWLMFSVRLTGAAAIGRLDLETTASAGAIPRKPP